MKRSIRQHLVRTLICWPERKRGLKENVKEMNLLDQMYMDLVGADYNYSSLRFQYKASPSSTLRKEQSAAAVNNLKRILPERKPLNFQQRLPLPKVVRNYIPQPSYKLGTRRLVDQPPNLGEDIL
ncbi:unnamed protein product [Cylicostephanus goldi]|uniref:Uncharacterized protein n=1 Tax=Cylicostephanus goldi TaxID=71465 RepID=A0A3P6SVR5_CYLGO|nr:unnamed protein product [Cylicostephanus goldi]